VTPVLVTAPDGLVAVVIVRQIDARGALVDAGGQLRTGWVVTVHFPLPDCAHELVLRAEVLEYRGVEALRVLEFLELDDLVDAGARVLH
jgi:hypothetical protein